MESPNKRVRQAEDDNYAKLFLACIEEIHQEPLSTKKEKRIYQGECLPNGTPHGEGKLISESTNVSYTGRFFKGTPHGKGKYEYPNGRKFEGNVFAGERHGMGILRTPSGESADGSFFANKLHGKCLISYPDGQREESNWFAGKRHGTAITYLTNGCVTEITFFADKKHGSGKATYSDGSKYEVEYFNGDFHGKHIYISACGVIIEEDWKYNSLKMQLFRGINGKEFSNKEEFLKHSDSCQSCTALKKNMSSFKITV